MGQGGWEGEARGRRYGDLCVCIADSLCYKAETNTIVSNYTPVKMLKKKKKDCLIATVLLVGRMDSVWFGEGRGYIQYDLILLPFLVVALGFIIYIFH